MSGSVWTPYMYQNDWTDNAHFPGNDVNVGLNICPKKRTLYIHMYVYSFVYKLFAAHKTRILIRGVWDLYLQINCQLLPWTMWVLSSFPCRLVANRKASGHWAVFIIFQLSFKCVLIKKTHQILWTSLITLYFNISSELSMENDASAAIKKKAVPFYSASRIRNVFDCSLLHVCIEMYVCMIKLSYISRVGTAIAFSLTSATF